MEEATNVCIRFGYLHHIPWGVTLPQTLLMRDVLCTRLSFLLKLDRQMEFQKDLIVVMG